MVRIKCDMHGWMAAYAGVLDHPYFAVTAPGGTFEIKQLPPGTYTIEAWHETLGTQTRQVTLAEKQFRRSRVHLQGASGDSSRRQGGRLSIENVRDLMRTTAAMTIGVRGRATDYVALAKPRLNLLVVVSAVAEVRDGARGHHESRRARMDGRARASSPAAHRPSTRSSSATRMA